MPEPVLSVVLTVVDGGDALRRCLSALVSQNQPPPMEVLIPWDASIPSVPPIVSEHQQRGEIVVRGVELGRLPIPAGAAASRQHELIDRRRAAGLADARGEIVAIVEDRAVPRANWAAAFVRLHRELPYAVIGGAVENGRPEILNQAVYFCDFGRYQLPFEAGPRSHVTDVNVSYKRGALERTRHIWRDRYHEPLVHRALEHAGETLFLSPEPIVDQMRDGLTLRGLLAERVAWGRLFGSLRVLEARPSGRVLRLISAPAVPMVLFARFLRDRLAKGASAGVVVRVSPAVGLLLVAWVAGETAGYLTGRRGSPSQTATKSS